MKLEKKLFENLLQEKLLQDLNKKLLLMVSIYDENEKSMKMIQLN